MAKLTPRQIYALAADAGFKTPGQAITMTAIALAESGGDTEAVNTNRNGSTDTGLWQINSIHGYSTSALKDPRTNARAAKAVHAKQGYAAWVVFTTTDPQRSYKQYLQEAIAARPDAGMSIADILKALPVAAGTLTSVGADVAGNLNPLAGITELALKAGTWINNPQNWLRIVYVMLGGALVIGALVVVAGPVAKPVVKAAADIAV